MIRINNRNIKFTKPKSCLNFSDDFGIRFKKHYPKNGINSIILDIKGYKNFDLKLYYDKITDLRIINGENNTLDVICNLDDSNIHMKLEPSEIGIKINIYENDKLIHTIKFRRETNMRYIVKESIYIDSFDAYSYYIYEY